MLVHYIQCEVSLSLDKFAIFSKIIPLNSISKIQVLFAGQGLKTNFALLKKESVMSVGMMHNKKR